MLGQVDITRRCASVDRRRSFSMQINISNYYSPSKTNKIRVYGKGNAFIPKVWIRNCFLYNLNFNQKVFVHTFSNWLNYYLIFYFAVNFILHIIPRVVTTAYFLVRICTFFLPSIPLTFNPCLLKFQHKKISRYFFPCIKLNKLRFNIRNQEK